MNTLWKWRGMGAGRRRRRGVRLLTADLLAAACVIVGLTAPSALAAPASGAAHARPDRGYGVSPVTEVSTCGGYNAEVVQAVGKPSYIYETWIGCGGEGFARSTDGGLHFQKPITLPDSSFSDDPAIAVAPSGTVYVSYLRYHKGYAYPVKIICSPIGSCAYEAVDATAVIQRSTDSGRTWSGITPMQRGFPAGGGYDGSVLVQPDGRVDTLIWGHHLNPVTYKVHPGHEFFTSSSDSGRTWSPLVRVGPTAGSIAVPTWWIDGNLGMDRAGNLYATWDTQTASGDIGWISYSTNHGSTWSAPLRVTSDNDNAVHNMEVVGGSRGVAYVAWQADNSPLGYATYLRPYSITRGWLAPATRVSSQFGNKKIWPGDTFGISVLSPDRVALSWGSAIENHIDSEIYAVVVQLPRHAI